MPAKLQCDNRINGMQSVFSFNETWASPRLDLSIRRSAICVLSYNIPKTAYRFLARHTLALLERGDVDQMQINFLRNHFCKFRSRTYLETSCTQIKIQTVHGFLRDNL